MVRKKAQAIKKSVPKKKQICEKKNRSIILTKNFEQELFIGKILVGTTFNIPPEQWLQCRITFLSTPDEVDRIHLEFDEISVIVTLIIETDILKGIITANVFNFEYSLDGEDFFIHICFKELPLRKFNNRVGNTLKNLFTMTQKLNLIDEDDINKKLCGAVEISELYKCLASKRNNIDGSNIENVQHCHLKPQLQPYQKEAIKWMLSREYCVPETETLHPLYSPIALPSGLEIFFDKYSGHVTSIKPTFKSSYSGGILAEEMGLGKTVEFLALVLNNPYTPNEEDSVLSTNDASESELSDNNDADYPIIKKQPKKHYHAKKMKKEEDSNFEYKAKDIRVPNDWVKTTKNKGTTYTALHLWYSSALSEVNHKPLRPKETINCICGETHESGKIQCKDCKKFQHAKCLGYEKSFGSFYCPSCWLEHPLVQTRATLVVTPISLRTQWCNEIRNHVNKRLRILVYEGSSKTPVYPTYLKNFDIVITTYNVLQSEFRLSDKGQVFDLRRKRKYDYPGSPLSRIKWWRLCLDEAQTVETPGKIVSAMARKLTAQHRWAVTGTPISKNISDLYGLVDYLQIEPYNELDTWNHLLHYPALNGNMEPLCEFLSQVMWRSSKAEVIDQINIPSQTVLEHSLEFSAVEKFFYNKEHELSSRAFLEKLKNIDTSLPLAKLDRGIIKKIMVPLLSLRQVCIHPNTVKGKYLAARKKVTTMKELLDALIVQNTTESEDFLRLAVSSLNGQAGIHLLMQDPLNAAEKYRKVLQFSARFSGENKELDLSVDKLQLIHAMHNLADLLSSFPDIPPTLRDSTLRNDCKLLEQQYIEKYTNETVSAYQDSQDIQSHTNTLQEQFLLSNGQWYSDGIEWISMKDYQDDLMNRIKNLHENVQVPCPPQISNERTILYYLAHEDETLTNSRADLIETLDSLYAFNPDEKYKITVDQKLVQQATDCHLRPEKKTTKKKKCPLCSTNDLLKKYEFKLFTMSKRKSLFEDMSLQGSWKAASQELIIRALSSLMKSKNAAEPLVKDSETHINILENLKKEFKAIRKFWTHICEQVAAQDELDMCKIRLRLQVAEESSTKKSKKETALKRLSYLLENKLDNIHMLNEHELEYHMLLMQCDETKGKTSLEKNVGIRSYLETLRKQQYENQSPDPCPICRNVLDQHWSILPCGHNYCMECIHKLMEQTSSAKIICCVCRQSLNVQDVSYIRNCPIKNESADVEIRGNFSTKIEAIIKLLVELRSEDAKVKVLVFSSWITVLKFLKDALELNEIKTEILLNWKLEERIETFKDDKKGITALLLPISLGGKGLNLIEATHVILVEPLLNPGDELQAIGRVHRIGQTRPTYVHKFHIKNTIEESIVNATSQNADKWDKNKVTLNQLKDLFQKVEESPEVASCDDTPPSENTIEED